MNINKYLSKVNYNTLKGKLNKYIVIHFTANNGDTALGNCKYFYTEDRGASAHYFVDENGVWQCVEDNNVAWHCGASIYKHPYCRNGNSIGVEMCSRKDSNGNYYIMDKTVNNTVELVKYLMNKYNVPIDNVIRHYDVTGKNCPEPFVRDIKKWQDFKNMLKIGEEEEMNNAMVSEGKAIVNGKEYKVDRILKDGINYIRAANFNNMGFVVGYDEDTKAVTIDNKIGSVNINGNDVKAVNIRGFNYVSVRDMAEVLWKKVDYVNGKIVVE